MQIPTLKEFLADKDGLSHNDALEAARSYLVVQGHLIPSNTVNHWLAGLDMTGIVQDIAEDKDHPARHKMASILLSITSGDPMNIILGTSAGDGTNAMLDWCIDTGMPEYSTQLTAFKEMAIAYANRPYFPFERATLHDVLIIRDDCPTKAVEPDGGWATIGTNTDTERHNPRLLAQSPRTGKWQRVNSFMGVETAGVYECRVPREFSGWPLAADNPYGAVV